MNNQIDRLSPLPFWLSLRADAIAHIPPEERSMSWLKKMLMGLKIGLFSSGFHLCLLYRTSYTARAHGGIVGKLISQLLFWWMRHWYTCAIASTARIHGGVIFPHPQGIVIGAEAIIGERTWIFQNVTIGGAPGKIGQPKIGNDCRIYTGSVIVGPLEIGAGVTIGANTVVATSVPPQTLVKSAPTVSRSFALDSSTTSINLR
jgi:serine O-acetyltransferase